MADGKSQIVLTQPTRQLAVADHRLDHGRSSRFVDLAFGERRQIDRHTAMAYGEAASGVTTTAHDNLQPVLPSEVHSLDHVLIVLDPDNHIGRPVGLELVPDHFIYQFGVNDSHALRARQYVGGGLTAFGLVPARPADSFGLGLNVRG
jgi:hypothetical protein